MTPLGHEVRDETANHETESRRRNLTLRPEIAVLAVPATTHGHNTAAERAALGDTIAALGDTTFDVYLNDRAFWRNVPATIWGYKLGGYQVLKKWLSYRERGVLGRALSPEEVLYFAEMARRVGAVRLVTAMTA